MKKTKNKISKTSLMHFVKLYLRAGLFLGVLALYIAKRVSGKSIFAWDSYGVHWLLGIIWVFYAVEMAMRFFPSKIESPGCQKQFKRNFKPTEINTPPRGTPRRTLLTALIWLLGNGAIGLLYLTGIIDEGILILISLAYGVGDMVCILFFCPFQTWLMKNRCCTDCRIYNWDFAMMFTPYVFIPHAYTWSLLGMSLLILIRWEITVRRHPEFFSESTNESLACKNCTEKLCKHKKQLMSFIRKGHFIKR